MPALPHHRTGRTPRSTLLFVALCLASLAGCASTSSDDPGQRSFRTPDQAVTALMAAIESDDSAALTEIFGAEGRELLSSGDEVADRNGREVFLVAMSQAWMLEPVDDATQELVVGHEQWPFPIPLVQDSRGWWFDTIAGSYEVLARRIGRNELAAIAVMGRYVAAQLEYAAEGHDGAPAGRFARKLRSDPGRQNGLYWPADGVAEKLSPLAEFAAEAAAEGYGGDKSATGPHPYYGYLFRIIDRQGANAPGGAKSYVVDGAMTEGFAMIAYPVDYENSGIMTFIVGPDGVILEADLGPATVERAAAIKAYDPGPEWSVVE